MHSWKDVTKPVVHIGVDTLAVPEWLDALASRPNTLELTMCRYERRDNDWLLSGKRLDEHLVVFVERGSMDVSFARARFRLGAGQLLWIPQNTYRELRGVASRQMLWQYKLRFRLYARGERHLAFAGAPLLVDGAHDAIPTYRAIIDEYKRPSKLHDHRVRALLATLATDVLALKRSRTGDPKGLSAAQRRRIDEFVAMHVKRGLAPRELADHMKLSLDYFSRLFRKTYRIPPKAYLKRERMRVAAHMLAESDVSVKQVAAQLGFENASFFCRQFRGVYGVSPGRYGRT